MHADASIAVDLAELLQLRHIPTPSRHQAPDANGAWLGAYRGKRRGHGTDYDDLRVYSQGDDVRHIDWRASARTHELQTRLYREEKEYRTSIVCDFRPCMFTGSRQLRANKAAKLSARLLWQLCQGGTRVTLIVLTSEGVSMIAPGSGHATAINACVLLSQEHARMAQALQVETADAHTAFTKPDDSVNQLIKPSNTASINGKTAGTRTQTLPMTDTARGPTLESLLQWLVRHNEHKSTLLWITGLDFEGDGFTRTLGELKSPSVSVVAHIDDPLLHTVLPSGEYHYQTHSRMKGNANLTQRYAVIDKAAAHQLRQSLELQRRERAQRFDTHRIALLSATSGDNNVIAALRQQGYLP